MRRILFACLLSLALALPCAQAEAPQLSGFNKETRKYQYVTFGQYPYSEEGETAPVLWRVLGPGIPDKTDIISEGNHRDFDEKKYANKDELTQENDDVFCFITEYIIDTVMYHEVKDEQGDPLDYAEAMIYDALNGEVIDTLFTEEEQSVLVHMPERGLLSAPSRKGELFNNAYGFVSEDFGEHPRRCTTGTPYAFAQGLRMINGNSWYWTTDWRRYGYRWIVGDNGHISVSGCDREGGIRPICYVRTDRLEIAGGEGTKDNPYQLQLRQTD